MSQTGPRAPEHVNTKSDDTGDELPYPFDDEASKDGPVSIKCQCGAFRITVPFWPNDVNECQCSICYRYGAKWGYYLDDSIKYEKLDDTVEELRYSWHTKTNHFCHCGRCGSTLYWQRTEKGRKLMAELGKEVYSGVNMRLLGPKALATIEHRYGNC